jgi:hypothetical protein
MTRRSLILCVFAATLAASLPQSRVVAASKCHGFAAGKSAAAPAGCPWQGPLIVNSDNDYWIRATDGHTVLAAHIHTQCRVQAQFTLSGKMAVSSQSVGLVSYQLEGSGARVTFYLTKGPPSNKLLNKILDFQVLPYSNRATNEAGSVTTKLPKSGGTDVMLPAKYQFPALLYYYPGRQLIEGAPAATLSCGTDSGKQTKIHLANRYGSSRNPYTATQMHDSSTVEHPIVTTYTFGPKTTFPEKSLLQAALKVLGLVHKQYKGEKFDPSTVAQMQGKKRTASATLGYTRYAIGQSDTSEMPMTRPSPCQ